MYDVKPWLEKAGRFTVEHIGGIPHFNQQVDLGGPRTGVLHTTEGNWAGSLGVFKTHYAPHFMLGLDSEQNRVRIAQLVQVGTIGAALVTHNWIALVQVEMIGYSKETLWVPDPQTEEALATLMAVCKAEYGIPLTHPWADGIYGRATASDPHRAEGKFGSVAGWYGHGDCPSPDSHWDPGDLRWSHVLSMAAAMQESNNPPSPPPAFPPDPCGPQTLPSFDFSKTIDVQRALDWLGFDIDVDGQAGDQTASALRGVQKLAGLPPSGAVTPETIAALKKTLGLTSQEGTH